MEFPAGEQFARSAVSLVLKAFEFRFDSNYFAGNMPHQNTFQKCKGNV